MDRGPDFIENRTFDEIVVGETASLQRTLTPRDLEPGNIGANQLEYLADASCAMALLYARRKQRAAAS